MISRTLFFPTSGCETSVISFSAFIKAQILLFAAVGMFCKSVFLHRCPSIKWIKCCHFWSVLLLIFIFLFVTVISGSCSGVYFFPAVSRVERAFEVRGRIIINVSWGKCKRKTPHLVDFASALDWRLRERYLSSHHSCAQAIQHKLVITRILYITQD